MVVHQQRTVVDVSRTVCSVENRSGVSGVGEGGLEEERGALRSCCGQRSILAEVTLCLDDVRLKTALLFP